MIYIILASEPEEEIISTAQSEAIRFVVSNNEKIFGEPHLHYTLLFEIEDRAQEVAKMYGVTSFPAVLWVDDYSGEILQKRQGGFPDLRTLFVWARANREKNG